MFEPGPAERRSQDGLVVLFLVSRAIPYESADSSGLDLNPVGDPDEIVGRNRLD